MTVSLWRIATETRSYPADDLSGTGAALNPGRWNDHGEYVVYTATTRALAVLETAAYVGAAGLPLNRFLLQIAVPDAVWNQKKEYAAALLPPTWAAIPAGRKSVELGSAWYRRRTSALLLVPSVIVPEEPVVLINAKHPDAVQIKARVIRKFEYDSLFR